MEADKLQRLHETLTKLAPRGKIGGLGFNSFAKQAKSKDDGLPKNALYSYFVRAGSGLGQYHKRDFQEDVDKDANESTEKVEKKKKKKLKKDKKEKKKHCQVIEMNEICSSKIENIDSSNISNNSMTTKNKKKRKRIEPDISNSKDDDSSECDPVKKSKTKKTQNKVMTQETEKRSSEVLNSQVSGDKNDKVDTNKPVLHTVEKKKKKKKEKREKEEEKIIMTDEKINKTKQKKKKNKVKSDNDSGVIESTETVETLGSNVIIETSETESVTSKKKKKKKLTTY